MATYEELYGQLTGTDFVVYVTVCPEDPFKRHVTYKNTNGLTGTLSSAACARLGITHADLPKIIPAEDLACAIKESSNNSVVWSTIDIAANGGLVATVGSGTNIDFKGSVESYSDLPAEGNQLGDIYQVVNEDYAEYIWVEKKDGSFCWDKFGSAFSMANYYTKSEIDEKMKDVAVGNLNEHVSNSDIHVTSDEKASWNAKAEESDITSAISAEADSRNKAISALDASIDFGKLINRIWIYGNNVYDLNFMVKPGMYYCSKNVADVGQAMVNMPEGTNEGCLLVLKNSQIFWEGGTNKGRIYYRYQTGAGPIVTEYTEEWNASAQLSDFELVKSDIDTLKSDVTNLKASMGDSRLPNIQFIEGGTVQTPAEVSLTAGTWYVAITPFTGTLPETPSDGTIVQLSYEHGQENMKVLPAGSDTINGEAKPCLVGISGDGTLVDNESHRFVYHSGNWILL